MQKKKRFFFYVVKRKCPLETRCCSCKSYKWRTAAISIPLLAGPAYFIIWNIYLCWCYLLAVAQWCFSVNVYVVFFILFAGIFDLYQFNDYLCIIKNKPIFKTNYYIKIKLLKHSKWVKTPTWCRGFSMMGGDGRWTAIVWRLWDNMAGVM